MSLAEHLEKLRYFHKTCAYPSLQTAAKSMGISQAGLSKSIQSLEEAIGAKVFVRSSQGLTLTASGKLLFETAEKVLHEAMIFDTKVGGIHSSKIPSSVHFGMYDSIAIYFYSNLATYIQSVYPKVTLQLNVEGSQSLAERIRSGEIDIALGVNFENFSSKEAHFLLLWNDHYSFYVNPKLEVIEDDLPIIYFPEAQDLARKSQQEYLATIIKKRPQIRVHNFETVKSLTGSGLGFGVMPDQVAKPLVRKNLLKQINLPKFKKSFGPHSIGLLVSKKMLKDHESFVQDLYRLGQTWSKN